jgi:TolA-binding protein
MSAMDERIRDAEQSVAIESIKEVMWGSRTGEGMVYVLSQMREAVTELSAMLKTVVADVHGSDGMRSDIRSLRSDVASLKNTEEKEQQGLREYLRKLEVRLDRLETAKIDLEVVKDWRIDSLKAREDGSHRVDKLEVRFDGRIEALRKEVDESSDRGASRLATWVGIAVSTIISVIALLRPHG